jgi:hypothetical protein
MPARRLLHDQRATRSFQSACIATHAASHATLTCIHSSAYDAATTENRTCPLFTASEHTVLGHHLSTGGAAGAAGLPGCAHARKLARRVRRVPPDTTPSPWSACVPPPACPVSRSVAEQAPSPRLHLSCPGDCEPPRARTRSKKCSAGPPSPSGHKAVALVRLRAR